jgi:malonyl-CoA O-methyltransferase
MFSCLGPDTLQELRHAFAQRGWSAPLHDLTDMHDWGDMLVQAGFSEPVMDMEKITLTYQSSADLLRDLRACGRNMARGRSQTVFSRHWLDTFLEVFEQLRQAQGGEKVHLTVEVIYGHAIKPMPRLNVGETTNVSLQQMKQLLGQKKAAS